MRKFCFTKISLHPFSTFHFALFTFIVLLVGIEPTLQAPEARVPRLPLPLPLRGIEPLLQAPEA